MKRSHMIIRTLISFLALTSSCQKAPELTLISSSNIAFSAKGGSDSIAFSTNQEWTINSSEGWIHLSNTSGSASDNPVSVSVSCDANATYDDRSGIVIIYSKELSKTINVVQSACSGIVIPVKEFSVPSKATTFEVEVQANVDYTVFISDNWIERTDTKNLVSEKLTFSVEENPEYGSREAAIWIIPDSKDSGIPDQYIVVTQEQKSSISIEDTNFTIPFGGGEFKIKVMANVGYNVVPDVDWIHHIETKAFQISTISLSIDKNESKDIRVGRVKVQSELDDTSLTLLIEQTEEIIPNAIDLGVIIKRTDGSSYKLLWADCNLGATSPEKNGDFYAWGETCPKKDYSWAAYYWSEGHNTGLFPPDYLTKYFPEVDNKTQLDPEDDVAKRSLGGKWRMPTYEEWVGLRDQCIWYLAINSGVKGFVVKSKEDGNDNSIFLPIAEPGDYWMSSDYWSSSLHKDSPFHAWALSVGGGSLFLGGSYRTCGSLVRPVKE